VTEPPNLHDAQLFSVQVDWAEKTLRFRLKSGWPSIHSELVLSGLQKFAMTTQDDWGPSVYVLGVKTESHGTAFRFVIEMQSGDVIDAVAASFDFMPRSETE
jgi:hypothetical protein